MKKIDSSYLASVEYKEMLDSEGQRDWLIAYYPGPKAKAEFSHFNPRFSDAVLAESRDGASQDGAGKGSEPGKLVEYFHRLVHSADQKYEPTKRELEQAARLIDTHGMELARYIIEFAHREAPKTRFEMQVFGAVLIYEKRAVISYEKWRTRAGKRKGATQLEPEDLARQEEERLLAKAEERIGALPNETFEQFYAEARKEILKRSRSAANWDEVTMRETAIGFIRRQMIEEILQEESEPASK